MAIGGGFERTPGIFARTSAPAHIIAVASPAYVAQCKELVDPTDLSSAAGIVMRSFKTGRIRHWSMRNVAGTEMTADLPETIIVNGPAAIREAARMGLGIAMFAVPDVLHELDNGSLVRLLPQWYSDAGAISLYFSSKTHLPAKTRTFADLVTEAFRTNG